MSGKAIRRWMPIIHEVRGRGVFKDEIIHIKDSGSKVKFIFADQDVDPSVMLIVVKQLITQAARLHSDRESLRSRMAHPSNPVNLVVISPDRFHKPQPKWRNTPKGVRGR